MVIYFSFNPIIFFPTGSRKSVPKKTNRGYCFGYVTVLLCVWHTEVIICHVSISESCVEPEVRGAPGFLFKTVTMVSFSVSRFWSTNLRFLSVSIHKAQTGVIQFSDESRNAHWTMKCPFIVVKAALVWMELYLHLERIWWLQIACFASPEDFFFSPLDTFIPIWACLCTHYQQSPRHIFLSFNSLFIHFQ